MKQNDWIVANINNPEFDVQDFKYISEMSLDNTQLLPKEEYLKSSYILENDRFKNQNGEFSNNLFDNFYKEAANKFAQFSTENIIDDYQYEYDMFDALRPTGGKIKNPNFILQSQVNPEHVSIGVKGFNEISLSDKSKRELAQNSKIYDPESGKYLDYSVNDLSLTSNPLEYFKSLFSEPLVYATYDEDTIEIDPITKQQVKHVKGEWKVNNEGEYYTEKLGDRSLIGKQVVSALDYLTPETSNIQKYDFLDADGLDKSAGGVVAKNVAAVLPLFIPYVNMAYSGLLVSRELSKSLPMLYGMVTGLSGEEKTESTLANTLAAYGQKFTGSTSDYAQQNTFSFENFGNLMSDVALQWGQQKAIANTFSKLTGGGKRALETAHAKALGEYQQKVAGAVDDLYSGKLSPDKLIQYTGMSSLNPKVMQDLVSSGAWAETAFGKAALNKYMPAAQKILENRMKIGQDLSLVYMAIISNTDVYESVLQKGGTPQEAAAIALGSTLGMFAVDKYLGLGEMFFNSEPARRAIRDAAKHNAELLMAQTGIRQIESTATKKGIVGLIQKGIQSGKKAVQDYRGSIKDRSLGFVGKSLGEGLEEVSEELVSDMSKSLGELAGKLGYFSQTDYGAWENAFDRYAMSFLGGAAGGAMFYGVDLVQNGNQQSKETQNDIMYLLRQGKKQEIIKELDNLKKKGKLGSTTLSYNTTKDDNGNPVYLTADDINISQSDYIYNTLVKTIDQLDLILNQNYLKLNENDLFDKLVQGEYRATALSDFLKGDKEQVKEVSYITRYQEDFQNLVNKIANKESEIQELINNTPDPSKRGTDFEEKLNKLKEEREALLKEKEYLFGEGSLGYVQKMLFAMDTTLSSNFTSLNFNQFVRALSGKSIDKLTQEEKSNYRRLWETQDVKQNLDDAFRLFLNMQDNLKPELFHLQDIDFKKLQEEFKEIYDSEPFAKFLNYSSKLEDETDEEYSLRDTKKEDETDEEFAERKTKRAEKIKKYNQNHLMEWIKEFSQNPVDKTSFRRLSAKLGLLKKTIEANLIEAFQIKNNTELQHNIWNILKTTGTSIDKLDQIRTQVKEAVTESVTNDVKNQYGDALNNDQWDPVKRDLEALSNFDDDTREHYGIDDYNYEYNPENPLTLTDLYYYIKAKIIRENEKRLEELNTNDNLSPEEIAELEKEYTLQDLINELSDENSPTPWDFSEDSEIGKINNQIFGFYTQVSQGLSQLDSEEANNIVEITDSVLEDSINTTSENVFTNIMQSIENQLLPTIENDEQLQAIASLESSTFVNNPVMPILKKISHRFRDSEINVEDLLESIYQQFKSGHSGKDFKLTDQQLKQLQDAIQDLSMAKAFFYVTSTSPSYNTPVGHNKQVNQFVQNHGDIFKNVDLLPEIDSDAANFLINEADNYIKEIYEWIQRSQSNTADKIKKFVDAEIALNTSRLEFFKVNREAFKINPTLDLLDGYDELVLDNSLASIATVGELLHRNYKKSGAKIEDILDILLPKIVNLESLKSQLTSQLDDTLTYSKLTDYDKLAIVISNFALSEVDFYTKLKDFINDNTEIAPLSIQEYAAFLTQAQEANPELINKVLQYLNTKLDLNIPVLENTTIVTGVGGSGKTQAVAKLSATDNVWYSGPTQSQLDNLTDSLPKGKGISKEELFELALGKAEAAEFLSSVTWDNENNKWVDNTNGKYYTKTRNIIKDSTVLLKDSVTVNKVTDAPKYLIIDEATHFSTAELQILSKFAKENNIQLILLGDPNQNGYFRPELMGNLERESILAWRTPKLFISLRDNNIQKIHNLSSVIDIIEKLEKTSTVAQVEETTKNILENDLPKLAFKYYDSQEFYGERITDSISEDLMDKLNEDIGFVGDENSTIYQQLKNAGKNVTLIDPLKVQGREFTYTVIDKTWDINIDPKDLHATGVSIYNFMKDLYTMISRSRKGTIIIDNGLSKVVKNIREEFTGEATNIKQAINEFRQTRLSQIEEALNKVNEALKETSPDEDDGSDSDDDSDGNNDDSNDDSNDDDNNNDKDEDEDEDKNKEIDDSTTISGTNVKVGQLKEETEPIKDNNEEREVELGETQQQEQKSSIQVDTPIRVYSNVSYSGIDIHQDNWTNEADSKTDLGIFLRKGEVISKGTDKKLLVQKLIQLKSIFNYGLNYYDRLPLEIQRLIPKESLEQAEYYISVEDENPNNTLVGLTSLDSSKRTINGKVITLKAKIKVDQDTEYVLTLGGLANPDTWERNEPNIRESIQKRIDNGDPESVQLQEYLNNLSNYILQYKNKIAEISRTNQEFRINTPQFSGMTTLIKSGDLRLEDINSSFSPYDNNSVYSVKSPIYEIVGNIPGIDSSLKGKPVMYVSSNILLNPDELESLYIAQKNDPSLVPQVRMVVLDSVGVSFKSLYQKKYKEIYELSRGGILYSNPFDAEPMAVRMYISMWNFRSNLKRFLEAYNEWKTKNNLTQDEIEELCKLDRKEYLRLRGDSNYLSEQEYRSKVNDSIKEKLKLIWDFNDSLANTIREFRLGYSTLNGAYIRNLTNLTQDSPYKDTKNVLGIYINPDLAQQYDRMLDTLFNNIINKLIPTNEDPRQYISTELAQRKGWFEDISRTKQISISMVDSAGDEKPVVLNIPKENSLSSLPSILIQTAKYLNIRGLNPESFDDYILNSTHNKYSIKFGDESLNWLAIADELNGGWIGTNSDIDFEYGRFQPGIQPLEVERDTDGKIIESTGIIDKRLDNLFSLMFHGVISTSRENDFTRGDIRATDATFKYGFFADPVLVKNDGIDKSNALVLTNRKLFQANVVPGLPLIMVSLQEYEGTSSQQQQVTDNKVEDNQLEEIKENVQKILERSGIKISSKSLKKIQSLQDLFNLVDQKIKDKYKEYFNKQELSPVQNLLTGVRIENNNLVFSTFQEDQDWLRGKVITNLEWVGKTLQVTLDDDKQYSLQMILNKLSVTELSKQSVDGKTVGEIIDTINSILDELVEGENGLQADERKLIDKAVSDAFSGNTRDTVLDITSPLLIGAINKIQNQLKEYEDDTDQEWSTKLNKSLTQLKSICEI